MTYCRENKGTQDTVWLSEYHQQDYSKEREQNGIKFGVEEEGNKGKLGEKLQQKKKSHYIL